MTLEPLGDAAYVMRDLPVPAHQIAQFLNEHPPLGVYEAVASYETVGLYIDPDHFQVNAVLKDWGFLSGNAQGRRHIIPVCYQLGVDLEEVGALTAVSIDEIIRLHTSVDYRCYAIGFCPGFPYLGYLPESLSGVSRLSAPRKRVEAGMVGITGRQTGIYPLERPGGWRLIGRTPLTLVDVDEGYFPIEAGDSVRFEAIGEEEFEALRGQRLAG